MPRVVPASVRDDNSVVAVFAPADSSAGVGPVSFAIPKSSTLTRPLSVTMTLLGFRSR